MYYWGISYLRVCLQMQTATAEAEQRQAELSALQREHGQARGLHAASLSEVEALHARHAGAAQRAEEVLAELALVRETQAALTAQASWLMKMACLEQLKLS